MRHRFTKSAFSQKDRVADLMSQGLETPAIVERTGMTRNAVNGRISKIRRDLGWQAC